MAKRCEHTRATGVYGNDIEPDWYECRKCEARGVRSLGPSSDESAEVQNAILDADAIAKIGGIGIGWELWDVDGDTQVLWPRPDDWSWDVSRPIAEQLAETARDDAFADALSVELFAEIDAAMEAEVYETQRAAEPDCRDEDDAPPLELGAKDPNEDAMRDPAVTAHNAEVIRARARALEESASENDIDAMADDGRLGALAKSLAIDAGADWPSLDGEAQDAWHEQAIAKLRTSPDVCACTGDALRSETCEVAP